MDASVCSLLAPCLLFKIMVVDSPVYERGMGYMPGRSSGGSGELTCLNSFEECTKVQDVVS
jgi:hypothetical protein